MTLLGTALRPAATRVMLLGSGELGPSLIRYQHAGWRSITPARRA